MILRSINLRKEQGRGTEVKTKAMDQMVVVNSQKKWRCRLWYRRCFPMQKRKQLGEKAENEENEVNVYN